MQIHHLSAWSATLLTCVISYSILMSVIESGKTHQDIYTPLRTTYAWVFLFTTCRLDRTGPIPCSEVGAREGPGPEDLCRERNPRLNCILQTRRYFQLLFHSAKNTETKAGLEIRVCSRATKTGRVFAPGNWLLPDRMGALGCELFN